MFPALIYLDFACPRFAALNICHCHGAFVNFRLPALRFPQIRVNPASLVRLLAALALAVGLGVWTVMLLAPRPGAIPPSMTFETVAGTDVQPVARWFGGGNQRVRVTVAGIIAMGNDRGAAVLSVDGATPRAYRVGETLAPGVTLVTVARDEVSIDQDGAVEAVRMAADPRPVIQGFVKVAPESSPAQP